MIIDSTDILQTEMMSKSRLPKNLNKDNYYLKTLQQKNNYDWKYRHNVVDVQEEKDAGTEVYEDIEVIIEEVYRDTLQTIFSDDWKKLVFNNIQHPLVLGKRFRFNLDFDSSTQDDKKNIWLTLNFDSTSPQSSCVVRRCNTYLTIVGKNNKTVHKEPAIIEDEFKFNSVNYNQVIVIPQGQVYFTLQYNQYTKNIKINDRFLIGPADLNDRENNKIFKITGITKFHSQATFVDDDVKLIFLAADLDQTSSTSDDLENRIMEHNGFYIDQGSGIENEDIDNDESIDITPENPEEEVYSLMVSTDDDSIYNQNLLLNKSRNFICYLQDKKGNRIEDIYVDVSTDLESTNNDSSYYTFEKTSDNTFTIQNLNMYVRGKLQINCNVNYNNNDYSNMFYIELRGNT